MPFVMSLVFWNLCECNIYCSFVLYISLLFIIYFTCFGNVNICFPICSRLQRGKTTVYWTLVKSNALCKEQGAIWNPACCFVSSEGQQEQCNETIPIILPFSFDFGLWVFRPIASVAFDDSGIINSGLYRIHLNASHTLQKQADKMI